MTNRWEQMEAKIQNKIKTEQKVDVLTWPGCYPLYYITKDGGVLCPECVNKNTSLVSDPDDPQWYIVGYDINWENSSLYCDHCSERIESAYADDENTENTNED